MKIQSFVINQKILTISDDSGRLASGEISPLSNRSRESFHDALQELEAKRDAILSVEWSAQNCLEELQKLSLLPSVLFGLESALLTLLSPLPPFTTNCSALLRGTPEEILRQADLRQETSAKLKVSNLTFDEAASLIWRLKDRFHLRIDVNRAWKTADALAFFANFPLDTFDYVEEPFQNPHDLHLFTHPLAVDESFPHDLSLADLEKLPTLKALVYKPTVQGGMLNCLPLCAWSAKRGIQIVLSSSFESAVGLHHIAGLARRLSLTAPVGLGI